MPLHVFVSIGSTSRLRKDSIAAMVTSGAYAHVLYRLNPGHCDIARSKVCDGSSLETNVGMFGAEALSLAETTGGERADTASPAVSDKASSATSTKKI